MPGPDFEVDCAAAGGFVFGPTSALLGTLDVAGNGVIVYADPERYNLTDKLLAKLEEQREEQEKAQGERP